jgi:copper(I)-binding protein
MSAAAARISNWLEWLLAARGEENVLMKKFLCGLMFGLLSLCAMAHEYKLGALHIVHPWARATPPGAPAAGAFLSIENKGDADRLVAASSAVADAVELHEMRMDGNVMRMNKLDHGIELPANSTVELKPGSLHIMFFGLKAPFKEGDRFPLKLRFEKAGEVTVDVVVEGMGANGPAGHAHTH